MNGFSPASQFARLLAIDATAPLKTASAARPSAYAAEWTW
jgi:hypothetical protein